ncbi:hypothetical protein U9L70_06485 [Staphylococcus equorum]|uniref:hypothetical protein n=1 Tax=Staphylococcus equorum TaxID=246432 RepID=UPI003980AAD5
MKIKQKKQLNLPQLIEWAWENDIWSRQFCISTRTGNKQVSFGKMNEVTAVHNITEDDLFTVEVEEEITEDTPLSMIIEIDEDSSCWVFENTTLKNIHETDCGTNTTKYYRDEDENMHIIWRDGKLVD